MHTTYKASYSNHYRRKVLASPAWITFTGAAQVAQVRRTSTRAGKKSVEAST